MLLPRRRRTDQAQAIASPGHASKHLEALERTLVWTFGSLRSGSTWLARMIGESDELVWINETFIGVHLVPPGEAVIEGEYFQSGARAEDRNYFFSRENLAKIRPQLRWLLLEGIHNQVLDLRGSDDSRFVVVKEPNGSHAADTILSVLPASRMIFLLRDGRDVVDSMADAMLRNESWWAKQREGTVTGTGGGTAQPNMGQRVAFVRHHSQQWLGRTLATQRAFDSLPPDRRLLVRYEDLLADTEGQMRRVFDWIGVEMSDRRLRSAVEKHHISNVPPELRGPGKPVRAATPGLWRESFADAEKAAMEEVMGEKLRELGYPQ